MKTITYKLVFVSAISLTAIASRADVFMMQKDSRTCFALKKNSIDEIKQEVIKNKEYGKKHPWESDIIEEELNGYNGMPGRILVAASSSINDYVVFFDGTAEQCDAIAKVFERKDVRIEKAQRAKEEEAEKIRRAQEERDAAIAEKERKAKNDAEMAAYEKKHEESRPKCTNIIFSGIGSMGNPKFIDQVLSSQNPEDTLARNPFICEYREWGGHYFNGGVINRNSSTQCYGVKFFEQQPAKIANWFDEYYKVYTDVDFDAGRRTVPVYIRAIDAMCIN